MESVDKTKPADNAGNGAAPNGLFAWWKQDLAASLVVFLVALPLCMGIALASGAPVASGLITGIVGGLVVGFLAGAPLQVSGPAAGLTVVCGEAIRQHGLAAFGLIVLIAGLIQVVAGLCRLGMWFRAVSPAVVHGMLSGIGILIVASQIHVLVDKHPHGHGLANLMEIPQSLLDGLPMPRIEEPAARQARIELLRTFNRLHEEQDEVERGVARTVTQHGSEELLEQEESLLPTFVPAQERVLAHLREARQQHAESTTRLPDREESQLMEWLDNAERTLTAAAEDLKEHRLTKAKRSQHAASESLELVLGNLKSHAWAGKVGLLAIVVIVIWNRIGKGSWSLIPAPLLAVGATTLLAWALSAPVLYVEVPDNLINGVTFPSLNVLEDVSLRDILLAGAMMAAIASAETLLCANALDKLHDGERTQYNRELCAQGIGNMICGALGALPMTGVIVRSAANLKAGAKTRLSAILHGAWLLLLVVFCSQILRMIPISALAGILVYIGIQLIDVKGFLRLWKESRTEAFILLATTTVIVVEHLLTGVIVGIVLSALKLLYMFSHLDVQVVAEPERHGRERFRLQISGAATFLRLPLLAQTLEKIPQGTELYIDLEQLTFIDHACFELLGTWSQQHEATGGKTILDWGELHARLRSPQHQKAALQSSHAA
jgi:MFS superfamily sulfate permease-like transporter